MTNDICYGAAHFLVSGNVLSDDSAQRSTHSEEQSQRKVGSRGDEGKAEEMRVKLASDGGEALFFLR